VIRAFVREERERERVARGFGEGEGEARLRAPRFACDVAKRVTRGAFGEGRERDGAEALRPARRGARGRDDRDAGDRGELRDEVAEVRRISLDRDVEVIEDEQRGGAAQGFDDASAQGCVRDDPEGARDLDDDSVGGRCFVEVRDVPAAAEVGCGGLGVEHGEGDGRLADAGGAEDEHRLGLVAVDALAHVGERDVATEARTDVGDRRSSDAFVLGEQVLVSSDGDGASGRDLFEEHPWVGVVDEERDLGQAIGAARDATGGIPEALRDERVDVCV